MATRGGGTVTTVAGARADGLHVGIRLPIPNGASLFAGYDANTPIAGQDAIPEQLRPPARLVNIVHLSFDTMVGTAFALLGLGAWFAAGWYRRRDLPSSRWFLRCAAVAGVVSVVSMEAGWVVGEVGRQPWTVNGLLLTRDAVTTSGNLWLFFGATLIIYTAVGVSTIAALRARHRRWQLDDELRMDVACGPDLPGRPPEGAAAA